MDHTHTDGGHSQSCTASSTAMPHNHELWMCDDKNKNAPGSGGSSGSEQQNDGFTHTQNSTVIVDTTCSTGYKALILEVLSQLPMLEMKQGQQT